MRYLLAILLILEVMPGQTQDTSIALVESKKQHTFDSLENKLKTVSQEKRFDVLLSLFREYLTVNQEKAQEYIDEALVQAKIDNDSLGIVTAYQGIAHLLKSRGKMTKAIELYTNALEIARRNDLRDRIKYILNSLAISYLVCSAYDKALYYHFESLRLREQDGDAMEIAVTLNNIGSTYDVLKDYRNALLFYERSYATKIKNNVDHDLVLTLTNISITHCKLNEFTEAEKRLNDARSKCKRKECSTDELVQISNTFGEILCSQGKYFEAQKYFEESLELLNQNMSSIYSSANVRAEYLSYTLYWLGFVHNNQNNSEVAIDYFMKSLRISDGYGIRDTMMKNYLLISSTMASKGNFKLGYEYLSKYVQLNSELLSGNVLSRITELRTNFDQRENLSKIAAQERLVNLQNNFNIAIGAIAALALTISIILLKMYIQKQHVTRLLDKKVNERTKELEKNRDELMHAHDEKVVVLRTISNSLSSSLATLKGLSNLATYDLPPHQVIYFKEVEATTEKMVSYVKYFTKE